MGVYTGYLICTLLIIFTIIISVAAQSKVQGAYSKYRKVASSLDLTGEELALRLAGEQGINISVGECSGALTDHYNPSNKMLVISQGNFHSKSMAAQAIVAHEFGHALQDAEGYAPLKIRTLTIKISNFVSRLLIPVILIGFLFEILLFVGVGRIIIYAYVGLYTFSVLVSLVTLPVEYDASKRAKKLLLDMGMSSHEEVVATDELLNSAALTYVASLLVSVAYLFRILMLLLMSRRN